MMLASVTVMMLVGSGATGCLVEWTMLWSIPHHLVICSSRQHRRVRLPDLWANRSLSSFDLLKQSHTWLTLMRVTASD